MPGDLLDLVLIVLVAAFAVAGYRQGFIVGVLSCIGFLAGAAIGATFSPGVARVLAQTPSQQALVAIIVVFITAMLGQLLASLIGVALRSHVTWRPMALLDSLGGAAVSVVSVLVIAWFIGSAVLNSPFQAVAREVRSSEVLRGVSNLMPPGATSMFSDFRHLVDRSPYTAVFGPLGAEGAVDVPLPSSRVMRSPAVARDRASILKVVGIANSCGRRLEGSGFVISRDHVLTNAHVVAGVDYGPSVVSHNGRYTLPARVVLFDPRVDVAVLYVPGLPAPPLRFFAGMAPKTSEAVVAGYPLDGQFSAVPARVGGEWSPSGEDIYGTATVTRSIYGVRAQVEPGNSGGPLIAPGGAVYGVVFAAAENEADTGFALTASQVEPDARAGAHATRPVSTQTCSP